MVASARASLDLIPLGERGFLARFPTEAEARAWASAVRGTHLPSVVDVVLSYRSVAVFPPDRYDDLDGLENRLRSVESTDIELVGSARHLVPVLYDGPDLEDVARRLELSVARVIEIHTSIDFEVFAVGFLPGFPYAGYLPNELAGLPRRDSPRASVPRGSVALAGRQTGIYPCDSPGGWHLLGRTPLIIADPDSGVFPILAGDRIRFQSINECEFNKLEGLLLIRN